MKKYYVVFVLVFLGFVFTSCNGKTGAAGPAGPAGPQQPGLYYVKNFQNGVYPSSYTGQAQSSIYAGYSDATYTASTEPVWFGRKSLGLYYRALFKFDLSSIPLSKIIIDKAELTIKTNLNIAGSGVTGANVHKITTMWNTTQVGWDKPTPSTGWITFGGGGDFDSTTMTTNAAAFDIGANDTVTMDLDPAVVQSWTSNPATNYGMIFIAGDEAAGKYVEFYPSGDPTPENRPILKVSYYTTE
jgi:hypothetical protein